MLFHGAFEASINFQPTAAPVPAGYMVDAGDVYGVRGNGHSYGWTRNMAAGAVDRNNSRSPDQRHDTLIHMQYYGAGSWEIEVPDGLYSVTLVAGDPTYVNTTHKISVENALAINGTTTSGTKFLQGAVTVNVTDGRLTIANVAGATNNKICFIDIEAVHNEGNQPPAVQLTSPAHDATFTAGSSISLSATAEDSDGSISKVEFFQGSTKLGEDLVAPYAYLWTNAPQGSYSLTAIATDNLGFSTTSTPVGITINPPPSGQTPFSGTPVTIPDFIQAENFDNGGEGVAFHDFETANRGNAGSYRATSVDVQAINDGGAGYGIGFTRAGEWLEYTIDVPSAGDYTLEVRFASGSNGGKAHVEFNGVNKTGQINLNNTGGWNAYTTLTRSVTLDAGVQVMRISFDSSNTPNQDIGNLNYIRLLPGGSVNISAPTQLSAFNVFSEQVNLIWNDASNNESGFVVDRKTGAAGTWATIGTTVANVSQYFDATAVPGTTYFYRVFAVQGAASSDPSVEASSITDAEPAWISVPSLNTPDPRLHSAAIELDGKLYIFGGLVNGVPSNRADVFDPRTGQWTELPSLPSAAAYTGQAIATDGTFVYLAGGRNQGGNAVNSVYRFDPVGSSYSLLTALPTATTGAGATAYDRALHVFGGEFTTAHHRLNLTNVAAGWTARASLPQTLADAGVVVIEGQIYALGGKSDTSGSPQAANALLRYDPQANLWTAREALPEALTDLRSSVLVVDGKILALGGTRGNGAASNRVLAYDLISDRWSDLAPLATGRKGGAALFKDQALYYVSGESATTITTPFVSQTLKWQPSPQIPLKRTEPNVGSFNGKMIVFSGYIDGTYYPTKQVHAYDPYSRIWTRLNDMPVPITHMGTVEDGNNLWMAGGYVGHPSGSGQIFSTTSVYIYDSIADTYTLSTPLPQARGAGTMSIVGRQLYFIGGANSARQDVTTHWSLNLDNPGAGWQDRAALPTKRNHLASVTLNGKIYVIGGQQGANDSTGVQNVVEVYDPVTNTWATKAPLPKLLGHIKSSTLVVDGRILVIGGSTTNNGSSANVYAYNEPTNTWATLTSLPAARKSGAVVFIGGKLIFAAGEGGGIQEEVWETAV